MRFRIIIDLDESHGAVQGAVEIFNGQGDRLSARVWNPRFEERAWDVCEQAMAILETEVGRQGTFDTLRIDVEEVPFLQDVDGALALPGMPD